MDIEINKQQEKMLKLREQLRCVEEERRAGSKDCSLDELDKYLDDIISQV